MVDQRKNRSRRNFRYRNSNNKPSNSGKGNNVSGTTSYKKEMKFYLHDLDSRKRSESFNRIKQHIILKIQETFSNSLDITESIESNTEKTFTSPVLQRSTKADQAERSFEEKQFLQNYTIDYEIYRNNQMKFREEWARAYLLIWRGYCSRDLQVHLEEMSDFSTSVKNNPLELLARIETLMHVPQKAKYPPLTLVEVLNSFIRLKQGENETLLEYLSRFKSEAEVINRLFGKRLVDGYAEQLNDYTTAADADAKKAIKAREWNKFIAILFLRNSESGRFNEMLIDYRKDYANGISKYPKDLQAMVDVMRQQPEKKKKVIAKVPVKQDGEKRDPPASSFAQKGTTNNNETSACYCCGDADCLLSRCDKKNIWPKEKWHKPEYFKEKYHKKQSHGQVTNDESKKKTITFEEDKKSESTCTKKPTCVFCTAQRVIEKVEPCAAQRNSPVEEPEPELMLDSGSAITVAHDKKLFTEIHKLGEKVTMETNGGLADITHEGHMNGYGNAYFFPGSITNIISVSDAVQKGFHVFFDSTIENAFYVTNSKGRTIRFPCNSMGLYIKEKENKEVTATTIEGFTSRQIARAKLARKLYHNLNAETVANLKVWI